MPPVDKSPCSVGQQLARSEDEMCNTQIPEIDGIGPNIWKGFLPGQLHIPVLLLGHLKQAGSLKLYIIARLLFVVEESNKFTSVHFLIDTK